MFNVVVGILIVYVVCLGIVPAVIIALMGIKKQDKVISATAVPLTESGEIL